MKTYSLTFSAGETKQLPSGVHLELITTVDAVDITYKKNQTELNEKATNVNAGYFFTMPKTSKPVYDEDRKIVTGFVDVFDTFDLVEITSATAQTIVIGITQGDGGSRSTATNLTGGTVDTLTNPVKPNTIDTGYNASAASGVVTLVTPAANINGIRIDGFGMPSAANTRITLLAHTSTPATYQDTNAITLDSQTYNTSNVSGTRYSNYPIIIPAGYGLYVGRSVTVQVFCNYEVL